MTDKNYSRSAVRYLILAVLTSFLVVLNIKLRWEDGDEGRYVVLAQAVAQGAGQTNIQLPEPTPEGIVPPGYLYALAGTMKLAGLDNIVALFWLSAIFYVVFVLLYHAWLRREEGLHDAMKWCVFLIGGFSVFNLSYGWRIHTEAMYFATTAAALFFSAVHATKGGLAFAACVGIATAVSALTRPVGIVLIPAVTGYMLLQRRWRDAACCVVMIVVCYLPTVFRSYDIFGVPIAYLSMYGEKQGAGLADTIKTVFVFLPYYFFDALPRHMFYYLFDGDCLLCKAGIGFLAKPACYAMAVLIAVGFFSRLRKPTAVELYWALYWPLISTFNQPNYISRGIHLFQERYVLPMIPLAAWYLGLGISVVSGVLFRRNPARARAVSLTLMAGMAAYVMVTAVAAGWVRTKKEMELAGQHPWSPARHFVTGDYYDSTWARYVEAALWIGSNTPPDSVVVCRHSFHLYLMAGRKSVRYDGVEIPNQDAWQIIEGQAKFGPVYVIQDAFPEKSGYGYDRVTMLDPVLHGAKDRFELAFQTPEPVTKVWKLRVSPPNG